MIPRDSTGCFINFVKDLGVVSQKISPDTGLYWPFSLTPKVPRIPQKVKFKAKRLFFKVLVSFLRKKIKFFKTSFYRKIFSKF